ncbi:MAG: hypothetical protein JXA20_18610 [Spirochaetes bacterium]|nr:hypothetical protein [Spirochaetota bacterium]
MGARRGGYELVIGLPSFMEADSIGHVVRQVDQGLRTYFGGLRSIILNLDNHSEDDTRSAFMAVDTAAPKKYISTPQYVRGKGNNLMNMVRFAARQGDSLRAAAVFDTDLRSITPEWVRQLVGPVIEGYDFVLPWYRRHQFDGTITNHLCYPLIFGLLGERVRQPIGGEYAFSPKMLSHLNGIPWPPMARLYGVDIFLSLTAISGGHRLCQAELGVKVHKASAPKLGPMFAQVVTTLFDMLLARKDRWTGGGREPGGMVTIGGIETGSPQELAVDMGEMKGRVRGEFIRHRDILKGILNGYLFRQIEQMVDEDRYRYGSLLWAQTVYESLHAYDRGNAAAKRGIIEALKPLHLARAVTFNYETFRSSMDYAEELVEEQARAFRSMRPFLAGLYEAKAGGAKR